MGFSAKQVQALRRSLNSRYVRTREANGREWSYIEGWYAISEANRIFGFDSWDRETVESRCVLARENRGTFHASQYTPKEQRSLGKVTAQAKAAATPRAKCTTSPSRPLKRMPPNARWRLSANRSGSSSTARTKRPSSDNRPGCSPPLQMHHSSRVSAYTLTIQRPSRGRRTTMAGGITAP
jgi:hypothetical protein